MSFIFVRDKTHSFGGRVVSKIRPSECMTSLIFPKVSIWLCEFCGYMQKWPKLHVTMASGILLEKLITT